MSVLKKTPSDCRAFRDQLEAAASSMPAAREVAAVLDAMPAEIRAHAACADCRSAVETLLAVRAHLSVLNSSAGLGGPWFAPRVMAAIAARKAELARSTNTWTFLPRLAARLTWVASIALLLASGWLYQRPNYKAQTRAVSTDITGEPVVEKAPVVNNDDVLVSLAEQEKAPE